MENLRNNRKKQAVLIFAVWSGLLFVGIQTGYAQTPTNNDSRVFSLGAITLIDSSVQVTGAVQGNKYFELVNNSTPTTPASTHGRLWLNTTTQKLCIRFSDGSISCFASAAAAPGPITQITPGLGLTGGGTTGNVTVGLSTPIATSYLNGSYTSITGVGTLTAGTWNGTALTSTYLPTDVVYNDHVTTFTSSLTVSNSNGLYSSYGASVGSVTLRNVASGTQCLHADSSGNVTGSGSDCTGTLQAPQQYVDTTSSATTSATAIKTLTAVSITPASASHHVKISVSGHVGMAASGIIFRVSLFRNNTNLGIFSVLKPASATSLFAPCSFTYVDPPATTSSVTYTVGIQNNDASTSVTWNPDGDNAVIIAEETL